MIEVTDEMQQFFENELWDIGYNHPRWKHQRDRVIKRIIELHEQTKWVKFDIDDETTHPRDRQVCNVVYHTGRVNTDKWSDLHRFWVYASCQKCVTHWQPLPEFKE